MRNRASFLRRNLNEVSCLKKYAVKEVLGEGTVGTVYLVCHGTQKYAAKLQVLQNVNDEVAFRNEVHLQKAFARKAPRIVGYCVETLKNKKIGAIIMEFVETELDRKLQHPQSDAELQRVIDDVASLLQFAQRKKLVHGDTALFNIGYVRRKHELEMIFLDFDRSSMALDFPKLDSLRLISELYPEYRSATTKAIDTHNQDFLLRNAVPRWREFGSLKNNEIARNNIDAAWTRMYCAYCAKAGVKCLDNDACESVIGRKLPQKSAELARHKMRLRA